MKKMHFFGLLALALVLALSMAFVGCSSDSDDDRPEVVGTDYLRIPGKYNTQTAEMIISHNARAAGGYVIANDDYYVFRYYDGNQTKDVISRGRITLAAPHITFRPDDGTASFNGYYSEGKVTFAYGNSTASWVADDNTGGGSVGPGAQDPAPTVTVAVTPLASLINEGDTDTFTLTAAVTVNPSTATTVDKTVTWSIIDDDAGTIDSADFVTGTGVVTTPAANAMTVNVKVDATSGLANDVIKVKAVSNYDNTQAAIATITVRVAPLTPVTTFDMLPLGAVNVEIGATQVFTVDVVGGDTGEVTWKLTDNAATPVEIDLASGYITWDVDATTKIGTLELDGTAADGDVIIITATSADDSSKTQVATVTVKEPMPGSGITIVSLDKVTGKYTVRLEDPKPLGVGEYHHVRLYTSGDVGIGTAANLDGSESPAWTAEVDASANLDDQLYVLATSDVTAITGDIKVDVGPLYKVAFNQDTTNNWVTGNQFTINGTDYPTATTGPWANVTLFGEVDDTITITLKAFATVTSIDLTPTTIFESGSDLSMDTVNQVATYIIDGANATTTITADFVP